MHDYSGTGVRFAAILLGGTALIAPRIAIAQNAAAPAAEANNLEEIVVTATKRAERLKDVPVAVTAISGAEVASRRIQNFGDIVQVAPGPTFIPIKGSSDTTIQIRGQSSANDAPGLEVPVGVFIDDIYYGSLASYDSDFFDVDQIAVLRGPQGTTFGRNVVGGALQITSKRPMMDAFEAQISATPEIIGDGNFGFETRGFVNVPITQQLAGRIAYSVAEDDGYQHNRLRDANLDDNRIWSTRGSLLFEPTDDLKITGIVSYSHRDNRGDGPRLIGQGSLVASQNAITTDPREVFVDDNGITKRNIFAGELRADWDMTYGTVTSITGYRTLDAFYQEDADGGPYLLNTPSINTNKEWQFSQELRIASPKDQVIEYIAGVYYGFEQLNHSIVFNFNGTVPQSFLSVLTRGTFQHQVVTGDDHTMSLGPFAELKWHITPEIAFTAGVRYNYEDKNGYTLHDGSSVFYGAGYNVQWQHSWEQFTPRFILQYKPTPDLLFYGSVSNGFKGGGYTLTATSKAAAVVPLRPEDSWAYEVGAKTSWLDGRISANVAAYLADTKNLQVRSLVGPVLTDTNAGQEEVKGVELELVTKPFAQTSIGANYAYTDAVYTQFTGCAAGNLNCTGNQVPFSPRNDLTVFVTYDWALADGGLVSFRLDDKWASKYQLNPQDQLQIAVPETARHNFMNFSATYDAPDDTWSAQFWIHNLLDRTAITSAVNYYFYDLTPAEATVGHLNEVDKATFAPPRTIGITLTYRMK
jgi:iron complex outermembrane receptor protein